VIGGARKGDCSFGFWIAAGLIAVLVAITGGQPRVMAIERGSELRSGPLEQGHRLSSTHSTDISMAFHIIADTELIPNHLFAAANLIYTADIAKALGEDRESASEFDATAVLAQ
jgi:hypothetical protein